MTTSPWPRVDDAGVWKPARGAYEYAARTCDVSPSDMILVAVHPWDIHGAAAAGLRTAWLNRDRNVYPEYYSQPDHVLTDLRDLAAAIGGPAYRAQSRSERSDALAHRRPRRAAT